MWCTTHVAFLCDPESEPSSPCTVCGAAYMICVHDLELRLMLSGRMQWMPELMLLNGGDMIQLGQVLASRGK